MKKKEFKRLEFLLSMGIQIMGQAVAMKKLQVEELKLKQSSSSEDKPKLNSGEKINVEATPKRDIFGELASMLQADRIIVEYPSGGMQFSKAFSDEAKEFVIPQWAKENCPCPDCTEERKRNGA